ncbi:hypothetical protein SAMN02799624_05428 [Paenibacillus sp. UNC496MF]|uniref:hypothetical protein n=1 Tax=Paenibacillus sp. UNC496MF TaxID=1502753 RepID=UPI0008F2B542|nr:hypothetical protein [Paenibacillus sp. UNC496MF]SFJ65983.1 hypothetical protein SAMN02799624_05428 [Paenibacillus sp. UNC496MF]
MALTKILKGDLGFDLQQLVTDLENAKGAKVNLPDRLDSIEAAVSVNSSNIATNTSDISALKSQMVMINDEGNFSEIYQYDGNGNVIKQTVAGDLNYTVDYVYADPVAGTLNYSDKKYTANGQSVIVHKVYTYDNVTGNITGVDTTTTIV